MEGVLTAGQRIRVPSELNAMTAQEEWNQEVSIIEKIRALEIPADFKKPSSSFTDLMKNSLWFHGWKEISDAFDE